MLEVNTKVMIRSDYAHKQALNGQIGTITKCVGNHFEVTLNKEYLGATRSVRLADELVEVADLEMPIEPVDPEQMKKWTAEAKERAGA